MKRALRTVLTVLILGTVLAGLGACGGEELSGKVRVEMVFEKYGTIVLELDADAAPVTVTNFVGLVNDGFYDGLTIHRVQKGFVIQGGDPEGTGRGGPGYAIKGEFSQNGFEGNTLSHTLGTVSMARQSMPLDSAGSQFFIVTNETEQSAPTYLDGAYAGFGKVVYGMDTAMEISRVSTDSSDRPLTKQAIKSIRVDTKGVEYKAEKIDK